MTEPLEFEGRNIQAAVDEACARLQVPQEELRYEVISKGSSGIFGLVGVRRARIRVNLQEAEGAVAVAEGKERSGEEPCADDPGKAGCRGEIGELGLEVVQRLVGSMSGDASVAVLCDDGLLRYHITSGNPGVLIGKHGQTLEAIQHLVEKIVNRHSGERLRIQVDVGGYLEKRARELQQLAVKMAKKACRTGKPATVGQMNAHDRRIIHLALKDISGIRTQSVGQGPVRNLVIFPQSASRKKGGDSLRGRHGQPGKE